MDAWETMRKEMNDRREQFRRLAPVLLAQMPETPPPLVTYLFNSTSPLFQPVPFQLEVGAEKGALRSWAETPERVTWVFWRIEDRPAHQRDFAQARADVEAWWRLDRARKPARRAADDIVKALKESPRSPTEAVQFLRDQKLGPVLELENVALLIPPPKPEFLIGRRDTAEFRPFEVPTDKVPYPPANFVRDLLTLKTPGDSMVVPDQPRKHYYVAVLLARSVPAVPNLREFYDLFSKAAPDDELWQIMMRDRRRDFSQDLIRQLRVDAAGKENVTDDGNLKLPESTRNQTTEGE
jgi:hypothetical protein